MTQIVNFTVDGEEVDDIAIVSGSVINRDEVLTRLHSECLQATRWDHYGAIAGHSFMRV